MDWLEFEKKALEEGFSVICGIDEAGRGPLAGPVVAAAVVLHPGQVIDGVNDSKKLTEKKREALFDIICDQAAGFGIGFASEEEVDNLNILQATFLAMRRAAAALPVPPDIALIDGNQKPGLAMAEQTVVKGDARSASIAAASILAKVSRDRYMLKLDVQYPQYAFAKHKGYGTKLHYERIAAHGICPAHRRSFLKKVLCHD